MVQELHVLKCFSCDTFQTQIVKKTKKWECKICGTKQSIKKVYGRGSGKDCRLHTQKLNALRGGINDSHVWEEKDDSETLQPKQCPSNPQYPIIEGRTLLPIASKWEAYLDEDKSYDDDKNLTVKETLVDMCAAELKHCVSSKKKRKREMYEEDFAEELTNRLEAESNMENDSVFYNSDSKGNKKNVDYSRYNSCDGNYDFNSSCNYKNKEKVESLSFEVKKQDKQNVKANVSFKWAKYLDSDSDEETSSHSKNSGTASPIPRRVLNSDIFVNSIDGFDKSNLGKPENLLHKYENNRTNYPSPSSSKYSRNQCDSQISSKLFKHVLNSLPSHGVENKPTFKLQNSSDAKSIHPLPLFEQHCDIGDSDFELDF